MFTFLKKKQENSSNTEKSEQIKPDTSQMPLIQSTPVVDEQQFPVIEQTVLPDHIAEAEQPAEKSAPEKIKSDKQGMLSRLKAGLSKTSGSLSEGIGGIFTRAKLDDDMLESLEELLIMSDMGAAIAGELVAELSKTRFDKDITPQQVRLTLAQKVAHMLKEAEKPLANKLHHTPTVIMVVGVNGNGKTTTIGKLAMRYKAEGKKVMLAAADTFRAAAVEQLSVWATRADVPLVTGAHEADPASVAYAALERAQAEQAEILIIDTAGRLQNKKNLMEELSKIVRVLQKKNPEAPHHTLMVVDGTTGQNALSQAKTFSEYVNVTGFAVTKLDGTAKGGIVLPLTRQTGLPIHYIGVGEHIDDLQVFQAESFAHSLLGV